MRVFALEPTEVDLPFVRSLVVVEKTSSCAKKPQEQTVHYYLSSRPPAAAQDFAAAIRGHWGGSEIRNHWVRDALWSEDRTRSKHWHLNANLALLRAGLIALRAATAAHLSWPALFERAAHQPAFALRLLTRPPK